MAFNQACELPVTEQGGCGGQHPTFISTLLSYFVHLHIARVTVLFLPADGNAGFCTQISLTPKALTLFFLLY